jgi:hypothetical protein
MGRPLIGTRSATIQQGDATVAESGRRDWLAVGLVATLVACLIGFLAFAYGKQPIRGDGVEYRRLADIIARQSFGQFASDLRTYGYPTFLALLISLVGNDPASLRPAVFAAQLLVYIGGAAIGAVRIGRALGSSSLGTAVFTVTVLNPFLLLHTVQVLTDVLSTVLVYLAVVLSLPQAPREGRWRVVVIGGIAFLLAGFSVMVRPANLIVVPALALVWIVRVRFFQDVPLAAAPVMAVALAISFEPQLAANQRAFGVSQPLIVRNLYAEQLEQGIRHAKYVTLGISGLPNRAFYLNPFFPTDSAHVNAPRMLREHPAAYAATLALHAFALVDQDYPFTYVRDLDPWYRWPLSALNYLFLAGAVVGLATGLRRRGDNPDAHRRWFTLAALATVSAALVAIYLPSEVENRFSLPLYPLLTVPCLLAAIIVRRYLRSANGWHLAAAASVLIRWLAGAAALSIWLQGQAPVLVAIRAHRELPSPEQPIAALSGELPRQWTVSRAQTFAVEATNLGDQAWSSDGFYPVTAAVRFAALKESQHIAVGHFPRQYVRLSEDVPPNASIAITVEAVAPPLPGRYILEVQIFRHGVPDPDESLQRMVRVER